MPSNRGFLVTLDGPSGVGKTTVAALLRKRLREDGRDVLLTTTPSPSAIGRLARHGTHDFRGIELTLVVAADRYHHYRTVISPALTAGQVVICDRFMPSSLVLDQLDGLGPDFVLHLYDGLTQPDLAFILTGPPEHCARRAAARGTYSRLHDTSLAASRREAALFAKAAAELSNAGYPVHALTIGEASAEQVADQLKTVMATQEEGL
ncbi:dTMP kinase [Amycolatopsis sp. NPDC059021]|uniref:dTMP kinase n=1 Tax=Amycolatopsis sp. NPDC059021 TaxID=3346704 RepID=UPI0036706F99